MFKRLLTAFSVMLLAILAVACSTSTKSGSNQKIRVVATVDFYGEVAKAVGGNQARVLHLSVVKVDTEKNIILIKGGIPGPKGSIVMIRDTVKPR